MGKLSYPRFARIDLALCLFLELKYTYHNDFRSVRVKRLYLYVGWIVRERLKNGYSIQSMALKPAACSRNAQINL